jgi:hypothetical protein
MPRQVGSTVTALLTLLSDRDRQRLLKRLRVSREVDQLMRETGSLAVRAEPVPLHRMGRAAAGSLRELGPR